MTIGAAILIDADAPNYELAGRPLRDYAFEAATSIADETPVLLQGKDMTAQWRRFLDASAATRILILEVNRVVFCQERLPAVVYMEEDEGGVGLFKSDKDSSLIAAAISKKLLVNTLDKMETESFSLENLVAFVSKQGVKIHSEECDTREAIVINNPSQLAQAEARMQKQLRERALQSGVCLQDPDSVTFSFDTQLEAGVIVEPHVVFAPGVRVGQGARIRAFSHLEGAVIEPGASIGPYARLRPGSYIEQGARIGNFVETKQARIQQGAKVNHLSYVGDADVGKRANIGAGVITCNYDGTDKHETHVEDDAFIGSNASLVAPVRIGKGAYVGSGSVITEDVDADALAIARAAQSNKPGRAKRRKKHSKDKS